MKQINMRRRGPTGKRAATETTKIAQRVDALELRKRGLGYREIGNEIGISTATAFRYVQSAIEELQAVTGETAEQLRAVELERLDIATVCAMERIQGGDYLAISPLIRVMERRAKLLGLDMPSKSEITGKDGAALALTFAELARKAGEGAGQ